MNLPLLTTRDVLAARGPKEAVDPWQPVAALSEPERQADGRIVNVSTVFLANRECRFRCIFCDLWRHTLDEQTPIKAVVQQLDVALESLPKGQVLKLYNSGNFFDDTAVPLGDWRRIAKRTRPFERLIIENHPKLVNGRAGAFREHLGPGTQLEIALGLETIHPDVLPRLNKHMTADDFARAASYLTDRWIDVRAFILLRPPFMSSDSEAVEWALRSMEFAFDCGATCCSVIPVRANNGLMEQLQAAGHFSPPQLSSLEIALADGIRMSRGRVFADLWDAERFASCAVCAPARIERLRLMNLSQSVQPPVNCDVCKT